MGSEVFVRRARRGDVADIQRVARAAWHAAYDSILGGGVVEEILEEWYSREGITAGVERDAGVFLVATGDDGVVGYAHAGPEGERNRYRLYRLYVHPDEWRSGVGTRLLDAVETALSAEGVREYALEVLAANDVGVSFYEARGFERVTETETELAGVTAPAYVYHKEV